MSNNKFGQRVRELRGARSLREFAEACGISHTYIDGIEKGVDRNSGKPIRVTADTIGKIAQGTYTNPFELFELCLTDQADDLSYLDAVNDFKDFVIDDYSDKLIDLRRIVSVPLYKNISCGSGKFIDDEIVDFIALPDSLLSRLKKYFCQYADGDSMVDENIVKGDLLVFEKVSTLNNGQIGCFCVDENTITCKKFYKDDASSIITLQPANKKYSPIIVTVESMSFHIIGKLALVIHKR